MKKVYFIVSIVLLALLGCDQTQDFIHTLNERPTINFMDGGDEPIVQDSIKLGLKISQEKYPVRLRVYDANNNIREVIYIQLVGIGVLVQGSDTVVGNNIAISTDILQFEYYPRNLGLHKMRLTVIDNFGQSNSVTLELMAFENLPPEAAFKVSKVGQRSPLEYKIDASESFDRDERFGGGISEYEFGVQGKIFNVLEGVLFHIFPKEGVYAVSVRVRDNDGSWSTKKEVDLVVD